MGSQPMRRTRILSRLIVCYLAITLSAVLLLGTLGIRAAHRYHLDRSYESLEAYARLCLRLFAEPLQRRDFSEIDKLCKELRSADRRLTVIAASGKIVGDSQEDPRLVSLRLDRPEIVEALAGSVGYFSEAAENSANEWYVAVPVEHFGTVLGAVRVALTDSNAGTMLSTIDASMLLGAVAIALVVGGASWLLSRRIGRPLEEMAVTAEGFGGGGALPRFYGSEFEEMERLAAALNEMTARLQERIQASLRQQGQQEAMLSSMAHGILAFDRDGTIVSANDTCGTLLGIDASKLRGRLAHEMLRKPDLLRVVEAALANSMTVETDLQIHGQENRWLHAQATPLYDVQREQTGAIVILQDVTRLRRLETLRRDFVANVSHELKTPITSIKGFLETLLDGALEDKENAVRFMRIVLRHVNRLDAIIEDLLALSRIERGSEEQGIPVKPEPVHEVLQSAIEMCSIKAAEKQMAIELDCRGDLVAQVNSPLLEQAVVNLIDNAIKYSGAGAKVRVTACGDDRETVICVKDEGCGIEARHLPRLFERFYRVDKARSREQGGTGLGLAIVKHIALAHQGTVAVESTVGRGSVFSIRLPIRAMPAAKKDAPPP
jgi:two-component system phosphate regulon sensor histidine kinase PhoR